MMLTADQILSAEDLVRAIVDVPEWGPGAKVTVRMMTTEERQDYWSVALADEGKKPVKQSLIARLCAFTICDDAGNRIFNDDQIPALAKKAGAVIGRIADVAWELNQLGEKQRQTIAGN